MNAYTPNLNLKNGLFFWQFLEKYQPLINAQYWILVEKDNLMKQVSESFSFTCFYMEIQQCFQRKQMSPTSEISLWWQFQSWSCDLEKLGQGHQNLISYWSCPIYTGLLFIMSKCYIHANLVKICQPVHEIFTQASFGSNLAVQVQH